MAGYTLIPFDIHSSVVVVVVYISSAFNGKQIRIIDFLWTQSVGLQTAHLPGWTQRIGGGKERESRNHSHDERCEALNLNVTFGARIQFVFLRGRTR